MLHTHTHTPTQTATLKFELRDTAQLILYLHFDGHCLTDDRPDFHGRWLVLQFSVQKTGKVAVESLIPANQLIGEGQSRHQPSVEKTKQLHHNHRLYRLRCHKSFVHVGNLASWPLPPPSPRPRRDYIDLMFHPQLLLCLHTMTHQWSIA